MGNQLLFILLNYYAHSSKIEDNRDIFIILCFFGPLLLGIAYLIYTQRFNRKWDKGIFPHRLRFNRDNLLEAYICLAALMILKDRRDVNQKVQFMNSYFVKHFPDSLYNFSKSLSWSYKNPMQPKTVSFWINKNIKDPSKKSQILYFLVGIAMIDGEMIDREYTILKEILPILGLNQKDLDAIIATYTFNKEESNSHKTNTGQNRSQKTTNISARSEIAHKVLGVNVNASIQEIKAAYRSLVKVHHPDKFANDSPEQIKLAHDRFHKIQDAYELLDKLKG